MSLRTVALLLFSSVLFVGAAPDPRCASSVSAAQPGAVNSSGSEGPGLEKLTWARVLALNLDHTPAALRELHRLSGNADDKATARLLSVVLEEWRLPREAESLALPRSVFLPKLPVVAERVKRPTVIVTGVIGTDGSLAEIALHASSGNERVDQRCLNSARHARFRPAIRGQEYLATTFALTCHISLQ